MKTILALLLAASTSFGAIFTPGSGSGEVTTAQLNAASNAVVSLIGTVGTNVNGLLVTNFIRYVVLDTGNTTNIVIPWDSTNAIVSSPSNNFTVTLSGTPPAGYYQKIPWTLVVTNIATTSAVFPLALINGDTPGIKTPPSTNTFVIVMDGARRFIEGGISPVNTNQFSSDGSSIKSGFLSTNVVLWGTSVSLPSLSTNSIPYIGGGGIVSTVALSGLTLSAGTLTAQSDTTLHAGTGRLSTYQIIAPLGPLAGVAQNTFAVSNTVYGCVAYVPYAFAISNCTWYVGTTTSAGTTNGFGIYSLAGDLLWSTKVGMGSSGAVSPSVTAYTVSKGWHYVAATASSVTPTIWNYTLGTSEMIIGITSGGLKYSWTAANNATMGDMPSTLGTITEVSTATKIPLITFD